MEYKVSAELMKAILSVLQELPYKNINGVMNALLGTVRDQDASKKAENPV